MSAYTRKTYIAVSEILNKYALELGQGAFEDMVDDFSFMFEKDNQNFDADKFREACGA